MSLQHTLTMGVVFCELTQVEAGDGFNGIVIRAEAIFDEDLN